MEVPAPEPGSGQVRVKVTACGLNFSDIKIRQGRYFADVPFPYRAGREFSGVVDVLGDDVRNVKPGEVVFNYTRGRIVISGVASGQEVSLTNFQISAAHRTLVGVSLPSFSPDHIDRIISAMQRLFGMLGKGQLRVRIGHTLPLENAVEAFRLLEERRSVGKVLVTPLESGLA